MSASMLRFTRRSPRAPHGGVGAVPRRLAALSAMAGLLLAWCPTALAEQRLEFAGGVTAVTIEGRTRPAIGVLYTFRARRGQRVALDYRDSTSGDDLGAYGIISPNNQLLTYDQDPAEPRYVRAGHFSFVAPLSGEYQLELSRRSDRYSYNFTLRVE